MLKLPPPFGLGSKSTHISLRAPNDKHFEVREIAVAMGCPVFIADRVESCIQYSGRYDCLLNPEVDVWKIAILMTLVGGDVTDVVDMDDDASLHEFTRSQPSATLASFKHHHPLLDFLFNNPFQGLKADEKWRSLSKEEKYALLH